jgi:superfamily II DNA or RNA helicase
MAVVALLALCHYGTRVEELLAASRGLLRDLELPAYGDEASLHKALQGFQAHGLVRVERWGSTTCQEGFRDPVLLHAWRQGWSRALGEAYGLLHGFRDTAPFPTVHALGLALHTDAFEDFLGLVDRWKEPKVSPFAVLEAVAAALPKPLDVPWFNHLPPAVRDVAARALLNSALLGWTSPAALTDWLQALPQRDEAARRVLLEGLLHQGRFQEAEAEALLLGPGERALWMPLFLGLAAFLADRNREALVAFERAWESVKPPPKRARMALLPGPAAWFHALALILGGQADRAEQMAKGYGGRGFQDGHGRVWDGLLDLAVLAQGRKLERHQALPTRLQEGPLEGFIHLLVTSWADADAFRSGRVESFLAALERLAERSGMPWFQAQAQALAARRRGTPGVRSALVDFHEATPAWKRTLETLERLGQEAPTVQAVRAAKPRRLAWVLWIHRSGDAYEDWRLEAREQRQDKNGDWGPGRALPFHKVRSASVAMDFLTPEDHRGIEAATDRPYASRDDIWRVLHALAGHETLFLQVRGELRPLQVRRAEPELRVRAEGAGLRLELHPPCDGGAHKVVEEGPERLVAYAFTPRHREIGALLGSQGLQVPAEGRDQVVQAAASVATHLAVHSDLPLGAAAAGLEELEADATPELDLRPWGEGLRAQLRVRPVQGGPLFQPGDGSGDLILEIGGSRCRVRRDLDRERCLAQAVVEAAPALRGGGWEWNLDEPADCLGLLLAMEPLQGRVRVAWPEGERFHAPKTAGPRSLTLGLKGDTQWFALDGHLDLEEGRILPLGELLDLLTRAKGDFLPLGEGRWVKLERHFRDRLEGLCAVAVPHGAGLRLAPSAALALEELSLEAGSFTAPKAWKERASAIRHAFAAAAPVPKTFQAVLRPYQEEGFQWLARLADAGLGACLADDMGLGKTLQALALLLRRAPKGPALVVAPTSVVGNWAAEARRFAPTLAVGILGEGDRRAVLDGAGPGSVILCSYGLLVQERESLTAKAWDTVILDEAQAVKNASTQRSQAVMDLKAEARLVLSGTPVENHLGELWNLFRFLNPGLLGGAEHFTRTFALPIERDRNRAATLRLKRILAPFLLRRTKQEVLEELPSLTEIHHVIVLSPEERAFYEVLRRKAVEKVTVKQGSGQAPIQILAELMRLRRACCHSRLVEPGLGLPSSKLDAFSGIVEELLENRHRALVFSQFVDHLSVVREYLDEADIPYQYLDGATSAPERRRRIDAFQAGEGDLFLISLKAGGTGLNLTAADYVIHLDPWWNPAVEDQASSRAHRIGQDRPVTVYRLVTKDTIEEKILALHTQKRTLAEGILEGTGAAALSLEDMLDLLQG